AIISISVSYQNINYNLCVKWIFGLMFVSCLYSFMVMDIALLGNTDTRLAVTSTTKSLHFGHLGVSLAIISLHLLSTSKRKKILYLVGLIFGIIVFIKAGSRSPIIAFFIVSVFYI